MNKTKKATMVRPTINQINVIFVRWYLTVLSHNLPRCKQLSPCRRRVLEHCAVIIIMYREALTIEFYCCYLVRQQRGEMCLCCVVLYRTLNFDSCNLFSFPLYLSFLLYWRCLMTNATYWQPTRVTSTIPGF